MADVTERRRQQDEEHAQLNTKLDAIMQKLVEAEKREVARAHLDIKVMEHEEVMNDNGKQGLKSIRNEWITAKNRIGAIQIAVIIQVLLTFYFEVLSK